MQFLPTEIINYGTQATEVAKIKLKNLGLDYKDWTIDNTSLDINKGVFIICFNKYSEGYHNDKTELLIKVTFEDLTKIIGEDIVIGRSTNKIIEKKHDKLNEEKSNIKSKNSAANKKLNKLKEKYNGHL